MKALSFKVSKPHKGSIKLERDILPYFYNKLHFHADHQLTVINKSSGSLIVGDKVIGFKTNDVFLIGQNLAHMFQNDPGHFEDPVMNAEAISLYFTTEFPGNDFYTLQEATYIKKLLEDAGQGVKIEGSSAILCRDLLNKFDDLEGLDRQLALLDLLNKVGQRGEYELLSSMGYTKRRKSSDNQRMNDVFDFVMFNFKEHISLNKIAGVANMSPTAFCRYFKNHTRKSFSVFLNEVRIGHACRLLGDTNYSISQICYESGFSNLSNFNRQFKKITGYTPSLYISRQTGVL